MSASRRSLPIAAAIALTAAYAASAAFTTPFTAAADVVTALPIAALALAALVLWPLHPAPDLVRVEPSSGAHPYRAWVALLAAVVAWELLEYLAPGGRGAHPTLSSMADALNRRGPLKAEVFFAWLWLGVLVVREGSLAEARGRGPGQ